MSDTFALIFGCLLLVPIAATIAGCITARHHVEHDKRMRQRLAMAREAEATRAYIAARRDW